MKKFNVITISLLSLSLLGACSNSNSNGKSSSSSIKSEKKATSSKAASSSISPTSSKEELKAAISTPMTKENYQNLEDGLLETANVDDIHDHSATMQGKLNKFNVRANNILKQKISKKDLHKEKNFLTSSDYQKFKEYSNNLDDYAVKYQSNTPVINDDKTSQSTKDDYQKELDQFKSKFDNAKEKWSNSYDSIINS